MIHVDDPAGSEWIVFREWFGLPGWSRRKPSLDGGLDSLQWMPEELAPAIGAAIGLVVVVIVVFVVLWILLLPLALFLAGVLAAILALGARILSLSAWTIRATGRAGTLSWRVRSVRRSGRAMHEVASRLKRGELPLVNGLAGTSD